MVITRGVKMKKVVIFDFWGTLIENGVWSPIRQAKNILEINIDYSEYVVRLERAMMTKKFETLGAAFEAVCAEFGINYESKKIDKLVGLWNKNWILAEPYEDTLDILKELKGNFKLVLISNTDCFSVSSVVDKYNLRGFFDLILFSYEVGMLKTDEGFYQKIFDGLKVVPGDCLAVGDSIETDIKAAQNAGVDVVLIDRKRRREFNPKIEKLDELKEMLK